MDIKLNQFLQPENSPIAQNQGVVDSYQFFAEHERSSVDQSRIRNFNFSQGYGGTITLGGTANGAGELRILDQNGNLIVLGDTSGLTIYDGNLLVKNDNNTTIIDTEGIVSTANFRIDQITSSSTNTTTSTSYIDLPGSTLPSFVLTRDSIVQVSVTSVGYNVGRAFNTTRNVDVKVTDSIDGDLVSYRHNGNWILTSIDFPGSSYNMDVSGDVVSATVYSALSAGTHTTKLQYKQSAAGGTALVNFFLLNYSILGS